MISEAEILHIINEIHQYDVILMELKDGTIFGIAKGTQSTPEYFRTRAPARTTNDRRALLDALAASRPEPQVDQITLDTLLNGLRGMKTRHVWLERRTEPRHEMAFLNLKELASFLRRHQV
ncbi:hypothetical protein [[Eubacterium] cellulosolvens]